MSNVTREREREKEKERKKERKKRKENKENSMLHYSTIPLSCPADRELEGACSSRARHVPSRCSNFASLLSHAIV